MHRQRVVFLAVLALFSIVSALAPAAETPQRSLADILPPSSILFFQRPPKKALDAAFDQTALKKASDHPEIADYLADMEQANQRFVQDVAEQAKLEPAFVQSLFDGQLSGAVLDVTVEPGQPVEVAVVFAFELETAPLQQMVFDAVKASVERYREFHNDPRAPRNLQVVSKEAPIGDHEVLRVINTTPLRCVILDKTILFYYANRRDLLEQIVANFDNRLTAHTLARTPVYKKVLGGTEMRQGMGFLYINARRLYPLLNAWGMPEVLPILDVLGISGVEAIGMAGGSYHEGIRHTAYLYAPDERQGLLEALTMKPGAELAAQELPDAANGIMAARVNVSTLYRKLPELADAVERAVGRQTPLGLASLAGRQKVLGVPAPEMLAPLGDAVIIYPGPSGWALRFDLVDLAAFRQVVARMEQQAGQPFTARAVQADDGRTVQVRYFNRSGLPVPFAPSYAEYAAKADGRGVVFLATHPQALVAILRQDANRRLKDSEDCQRVMKGMGGGYGVFGYFDNRESYQHVYDWVVPLLNALTADARYSADPGKLPPGTEILPYLFGCGLGIKNDPEGITFTAYSPIGAGAFWVSAFDTPVIHGMIATAAAGYFGAKYHYESTGQEWPALGGEEDTLSAPGQEKGAGGLPPISE